MTKDAVYITGTKGEKDVLTAFTQDGKKKWEVEYGNITKNVNFPESRCTPTYSNGKILVVSGAGDLACVASDCKIVWSVNYYQKYNAAIQRFGISESPLVVDNKVIATPGGNMASMVAFNIENGNVVWETPPLNEGMEESGNQSPCMRNGADWKLYLQFYSRHELKRQMDMCRLDHRQDNVDHRLV